MFESNVRIAYRLVGPFSIRSGLFTVQTNLEFVVPTATVKEPIMTSAEYFIKAAELRKRADQLIEAAVRIRISVVGLDAVLVISAREVSKHTWRGKAALKLLAVLDERMRILARIERRIAQDADDLTLEARRLYEEADHMEAMGRLEMAREEAERARVEAERAKAEAERVKADAAKGKGAGKPGSGTTGTGTTGTATTGTATTGTGGTGVGPAGIPAPKTPNSGSGQTPKTNVPMTNAEWKKFLGVA
jgi:hypothetical protein